MANLFLDNSSQSQGWVANSSVVNQEKDHDEEIEELHPDFTVEVVQFKPPHSLVRVVCQNQILVMALATSPVSSVTGGNVPRVIRLNLTDPDETYEIICHKDPLQIENTFLDPTGNHLIISLSNGDNLYLHKSWTKPKNLKFQGRITAVGWDIALLDQGVQDPHNLPTNIILGNDKGELWSTSVEKSGYYEGASFVAAKFFLVYTLENPQPIIGINVAHFPAQSNKFYVVITTGDHLYQFIGKDSMEKLFLEYSDGNVPCRILPGSDSVFRWNEVPSEPPQKYGWLTGSGLLYGPLTFVNQQPRTAETVMSPVTLLPYPTFSDQLQITKELSDKVSSTIYIPPEEPVVLDPKLESIFLKMTDQLTGVVIKDRTYHFKVYKACFIGSELVDWLVKNNFASSRSEGVELGRKLIDGSYIEHVVKEHHFKDEGFFYHVIKEREKEKPKVFLQKPTSTTGLNQEGCPRSFFLTEEHVILLYSDKIIALNRLVAESKLKKDKGTATADQMKEAIVWENPVKGYPLIDFSIDQRAGLVFLYSKNRIYELKIKDETSYLWQIHLKLGNFEEAEKYANQPKHLEYINTKRADVLMAALDYSNAAIYLARSPTKKFEDTVLQLIHINQTDALIAYLQEKLPMLRYQDASQRTIIATWLLELYLKKLDEIDNEAATGDYLKKLVLDKQKVTLTIQSFLKSNKESLEQKSTFRLLAAFGRSELLLYYSALIKEFDRLLDHFLDQRLWKEALQILAQQNNAEKLYKHAPVLMANFPSQTTEVLIKVGNLVQAEKLIPALMRCDYSKVDANSSEDPVIKYLEFSVQKGCKDPSVHNLLLSLYMKKADEGPLLQFLQQPDTFFGLDFALQLSFIHRKKRAVALVYAKMGLYEEAMDKALSLDIELAKIIANKPMDDKDLRKLLWLSVVRHLMEEKKDVKGAMAVFQQCKVLGIDDVIRYLPDHMKIEDFSDEICQSLDESNKRVALLKSKMDSATKSAEIIRVDIKKHQEKVVTVNEEQVCALTHLPIKGRPFYSFPDGSCFLKTALIDEVKKLLSPADLDYVNHLQREINKITSKSPSSLSYSSLSASDEKKLQILEEELTTIVASENPFYSHLFISSVVKPFLTEDEAEEASWKL